MKTLVKFGFISNETTRHDLPTQQGDYLTPCQESPCDHKLPRLYKYLRVRHK